MSALPAMSPHPVLDEALLNRIREDFPILARPVYGHKRLAFLDTAASAQKPRAVIDAMRDCMEQGYANIHRGMYYHSMRLTEAFEAVRRKVAQFMHAATADEIVFVRGATEGINLIAQCYGQAFLREGDEVIISALEHHANIVPWQMLRERLGIVLKVIPLREDQTLDMDAYARLLTDRTRLVSVGHVSNALGIINPVKEIITQAHQAGAHVLLDGCQAAPHMKLDMQELGADFYVFSGHKLYGPTGIGILYGRYELMAQLPPYQGGGEMIDKVTFEETTFLPPPHRFEAGTPAIVEVIGLGAAIDYLQGLDTEALHRQEHALRAYATDALLEISGLTLYGHVEHKIGVLSFSIHGLHPQDMGSILDRDGVAIRAGHHCAQPLMQRLGVPATARASLGIYSGTDDIDQLVQSIHKAINMLG